MKLEQKLRSKTAILIVSAFLLYILLNYGKSVMEILNKVYQLFFPFILGGCIAFIINIPAEIFSRKLLNCKEKGIGKIVRKHNVGISIVASCFLIVGVLVLISSIIIPNIIDTIKILPKAFNNSIATLQKLEKSNNWLSTNVVSLVNSMNIDWNGISDKIRSYAFNGASSIVMSTLGIATTFASAAMEFGLAFIFAIYILAEKRKLGLQVKKILYAFFKKEKIDSMLEILKLTSSTFSSFISGQCTVAAILAIMFFIAMTILRLPHAIVVSIIIGAFSLIPMIGSVIGFILSVLLLLILNPTKAVIFVIVYIVIKQLEDNLIYPRVVGNSVGLPSILVLVSIIIGDKLLGVPGMLISIPLCSVVYVLLRKEMYTRLEKRSLKIE